MSQDPRTGVVSFTIAISQSVSEVVQVVGGRKVALLIPTVNGATSYGFLVGGNFQDVASGTLVQLNDTSGIVAFGGGATGGFGVDITDLLGGFTTFQVVLPAAQQAARTFKALVRL